MINQLEINTVPMLLWKYLHKLLFHLDRIFSIGEAKPSGNAEYMGVYCNARNSIGIGEE